MHDLDRTQLEMEWEAEAYDGEYEGEFEGEFEFEYDGYPGEFEYEFEYEYEYDSMLSDAEEMELAADFLEIMDDEELELFLGKVFKKVRNKVRKHVPKSIRRAVGSRLKGLARKGLSMAGTAAGGFFGGPVGAAVGRSAGSMLGQAFGLELEGLSPEDQEFEVARRFVRLSAEAAKQAAKAPAGAPPQAVAKKAVDIAVKKHAPGLAAGGKGRRGQRQGKWRRRGNTIVIYGV
jgi:hypothetical protein